ncbi:MerR family transcriptional regulator [Microscilla marina]|uniref:Transcriptional regulator n=1 Tax=Microscilla marina ATCC 23134 TaxID=313606 RepID=A1ZSP1_MICM2|nr:MerR family transcriptional regulator [Microscilla marina]EAY26621.1 transcriptional regulator [Microscilla marina ATCC 23134]
MIPKVPDIEDRTYTLNEVAQLMEVSDYLVRFWLLECNLKVQDTGYKTFTGHEVTYLMQINRFSKENGVTFAVAKNAIDQEVDLIQQKIRATEKLKSIKQFFEALRNNLN